MFTVDHEVQVFVSYREGTAITTWHTPSSSQSVPVPFISFWCHMHAA
jgi:hypothetical protein